jgi:hypothetical protein
MQFKQFITEDYSETTGIDPVDSHILDSAIVEKLNLMLNVALEDPVYTPETGVTLVRKILMIENLDFHPIYDLSSEGEEIVEAIDNTDKYVYILYYPTDDGYYDFYAEVTDEEGAEEMLNSGAESESEK